MHENAFKFLSGDPDAINYTTVGSSVTTITSNLNDMTRGMRLMAALIDNENDADNLMKVRNCGESPKQYRLIFIAGFLTIKPQA